MLVISRKLNERVFLTGQKGTVLEGLEIELVLVEIDRGKVRLGISAPQEVRILREELMDREESPRVPA